MKFVLQFAIIITVSFAGEILNRVIPLPVPASIYGLVLMFCCLKFKIFPLESVKDASGFFNGIMPVLFVPSSVGFINALPLMKKYGIQFFLIAVITTIAVMVITGRTSQFIIRHSKTKSPETEEASK